VEDKEKKPSSSSSYHYYYYHHHHPEYYSPWDGEYSLCQGIAGIIHQLDEGMKGPIRGRQVNHRSNLYPIIEGIIPAHIRRTR